MSSKEPTLNDLETYTRVVNVEILPDIRSRLLPPIWPYLTSGEGCKKLYSTLTFNLGQLQEDADWQARVRRGLEHNLELLCSKINEESAGAVRLNTLGPAPHMVCDDSGSVWRPREDYDGDFELRFRAWFVPVLEDR